MKSWVAFITLSRVFANNKVVSANEFNKPYTSVRWLRLFSGLYDVAREWRICPPTREFAFARIHALSGCCDVSLLFWALRLASGFLTRLWSVAVKRSLLWADTWLLACCHAHLSIFRISLSLFTGMFRHENLRLGVSFTATKKNLDMCETILFLTRFKKSWTSKIEIFFSFNCHQCSEVHKASI